MSRKVFTSKIKLDILGDFRNFEALSTNYKLLMNYPSESIEKISNERICSRYIIEITTENLDYCKAMMKKFELHHLDNLKVNSIIYENKFSFISTETKCKSYGDNEEEFDKNVNVTIIHNSTSEIVKYQEKIFDILWQNSIPADEKIEELKKEKETSIKFSDYEFESKNLDSVTPFDNDSRNIVQITRIKELIKSLLISNVLNSKSEILLTIGLLHHLRYFWNIGLHAELKRANKKGVRLIILYPEDGKSDMTRRHVENFVSSTEENVRLSGVSGPIGTVIIVDNAKLILIDSKRGDKSTNNGFLAVYSNNKSVVSNFGSLFDTLLNEKEVLNYAVETKLQLESSNKELEEYNHRLKTYSDAQLEFINLAAHELRTPTQAILGYIELLDNAVVGDITNQNYMNSIERNCNRLARLVEDLLDISRIESRNFVLHKEKTNLIDLIDTVIKDYKVEVQKRNEEGEKNGDGRYIKNVEILSSWNLSDEKENNPSVLNIMLDRSKIIQVLSNLINNSLNSIYNDKTNSKSNGNSINIIITKMTHSNSNNNTESDRNNKSSDIKNELLVTIKDTGKGMDSEVIPRLFEKFITTSASGTGLGLYISKAIIEAHGGKVWAENNTNEKGATFRFTLPATLE
ncbi:sensor histidine kinase [Candidatus Nitrosocosmicus sp. FF01]|uniref:sensor histidine kinase n=1 Tax=Candidatus Nitrosocosmicus sp. FF01 TaxID=3397670 RepID=UPI0039E9F93E